MVDLLHRMVVMFKFKETDVDHRMDPNATDVEGQIGEVIANLKRHENMQEMVGTGSGRRGPQGILESKAVSNLQKVGGGKDKEPYKDWNDKMINAVSQVRKGTRDTFVKMM